MSWIFVLGKNPDLSAAEISCYFENREVEVDFTDGSDKVLIVDVEMRRPDMVQFDLGGTLKIAEIVGQAEYEDFHGAFGRSVGAHREKFVSMIPHVTAGSIYEYGKRDLEELNLGNFKKFLNGFEIETKNPENAYSHVEVNKMGLLDEELVVAICKDIVYFGITRAVTDPFEYQKRDTGRPNPLLLGMSPSRAAILVNLVATPGKLLLDPFCGGGTVGQEALLRNVFVLLSDIDKNNLQFCRENMEWLRKYGKRIGIDVDIDKNSIRQMDATKLRGMKIDCIATEPYLGPGFRKEPRKEKGEETI